MKHALLILSVILNILLGASLVITRNDNRHTLYNEWAYSIENDIRIQKNFLRLLTSGDPNSIALLEEVLKSNIQNNENALETFRSQAAAPSGID